MSRKTENTELRFPLFVALVVLIYAAFVVLVFTRDHYPQSTSECPPGGESRR